MGSSHIMEKIMSANRIQELALLYERQHRPLPQRCTLIRPPPKDVAETEGYVAPTAQLKLDPSALAAICARITQMLQSKAHVGMRRSQAVEVTNEVVLQVTKRDLKPSRIELLSLVDLERMMAAWTAVELEPGLAFKTQVLNMLKRNGGAMLSSSSCESLSAFALAMQARGWLDPELVELTAAAAAGRATGFDPHSLAVMAKILSTSGHIETRTYRALESAAMQFSHRYAPGDLAMLVQALVGTGEVSQTMLATAASYVVPQVIRCPLSDLAALVASFSNTGFAHKAMFEAVAERVTENADSMSLSEMGALVESFCKLRIYHRPMFCSVAAASLPLLKDITQNMSKYEIPPILTSLASSFAGVGHYHQNMVEAMAEVASKCGSAFTPRLMARLCWSFRLMRHRNATFLTSALNLAVKWSEAALDVMNSRHTSNTITAHLAKGPDSPTHPLLPGNQGQKIPPPEQQALNQQTSLNSTSSPAREAKHLTDNSAYPTSKPAALSHPSSLPVSYKIPVKPFEGGRYWGGHTPASTLIMAADVVPSHDAQSALVWSLVKILSVTSFFGLDTKKGLRVTYPMVIQEIAKQKTRQQLMDQHIGFPNVCWADSPVEEIEDVCCLLDPLVQQIQLEWADAWEQRYIQLARLAMLLVVDRVKEQLGVPLTCRMQMVQAYVAVEDAGCGHQLRLELGGSRLIIESLTVWKHLLKTKSPKKLKQNQAFASTISKLLLQLGASHVHTNVLTPDGLFESLVLATYRGRQLSIDIVGSDDYPINAWHNEPEVPTAANFNALGGGGSSLTAMSRPSTAPLPNTSRIQKLGHAKDDLKLRTLSKPNSEDLGASIFYPFVGGAAAGVPFNVGGASVDAVTLSTPVFRSHALRRRTWLAVQLPWWEWKQVVGSELKARAYLEHNLKKIIIKISPTGILK
ncbi:hypothetical protein CEUSTIGMA_g12252.t1 [Chlamydomonas eustigma]|uniref:RAP domain-containing protein n=1 Tax=Chlamydomonas eustigma TaxID=1157962 RepID=A0A250XP32_9CHLO|nr:hypothetical protein CEUSTIGMA_g12252.t1 [Chlamydomonas eustigma]|eukprot:GAX84831.1 hypothetical protein CEUSTIGMA_g12252.t1 [Chlamydomonas eustigma]